MTGRIVSWDRDKGYGYLDAEGQRVFLHRREFAEHHKSPETGDVIVFDLGTDRHGRTCATKALHHNDGGRIRSVHVVLLAALLVAPAIATWRIAQEYHVQIILGWYAGASALTYFVYWDDKMRARSGAWRARETTLHVFELAGGWPGAFLGQRRLRHKSSKLTYQIVFWLIVAVHQFAAMDYLLGWQRTRANTSVDDIPLSFTRLDLRDGRKLKNVVVKSYDAASETLQIVADDTAMSIRIQLVPPPFDQKLRSVGPAATGAAMAPRTLMPASAQYTFSQPVAGRVPPTRPLATAADQYATAASVTRSVPQRNPTATVPPRAAPQNVQRPALPQPPQPMPRVAEQTEPGSAPANVPAHQVAAKARAEQYYRHEFRLGSQPIYLRQLTLAYEAPQPITGWSGRYRTEGKAFIEYHDGRSQNSQQTSSAFEVITEQKPGQQVTVVDFTRKT